MQCLACICNLAACFIEDLRCVHAYIHVDDWQMCRKRTDALPCQSIHPHSECSRLIDLIAHLTFCSVQGCIQVGRSVKGLIGGGDERAPRC